MLALGVILTVCLLISTLRASGGELRYTAALTRLSVVSGFPMVLAGLSLLLEWGGGLYWGLVEIVAALAASMYGAWVLLIEIRR